MLRLTYTLKDMIEITPERLAMEERMRELILVEGLEPVVPTYTNEIGMEFAWIPPGKFLMGSPEDEPEREETETRREVTLTKGFWLQTTAVTQLQWEQVEGYNPSQLQGDELPVESVRWLDCDHFCYQLSKWTNQGTGLPTDEQWEYACRGGTTSAYWFGETITRALANYHVVSPQPGHLSNQNQERKYEVSFQQVAIPNQQKTVEVKTFIPNSWGIYQMHGNVFEWCQTRIGKPQPDPFSKRVIRGGSLTNRAKFLRSSYRNCLSAWRAFYNVGFRCVVIPD